MRRINYRELKEKFFEFKATDNIKDVHKIIRDVKKNGDQAVRKYTKKFDRAEVDDFRIAPREIENALKIVDRSFLNAAKSAKNNIERFSRVQLKQLKNFEVKIRPGVYAEQRITPIKRIGIYVPGGRFPLVSTVLMCSVPAKVAGVKEIVLCSPPSYNGSIHPAILATAHLAGVKEIYRIGGIQAIAALAYGTESIKPVDKIYGPGNEYVTMAKKLVYGDVGIDFIAGPSEILVIADNSAEPEIIAADLLAQAEHDTNATAILITDCTVLAEKVSEEVRRQLRVLPTRLVARKSLMRNGFMVIVKNLNQAVEIANKKAPEHLELQVKNPDRFIDKLTNYGSLFVGRYSAEVLGDYSSGLNHTLPTSGAARYTGGLHIKDFLKIQTILKVNKQGFTGIGPIAERLAQTEGLWGHFNSVRMRKTGK
ncbi:MAG: histidinol dehydrogenase [candidate division WOR-3 bacterium]